MYRIRDNLLKNRSENRLGLLGEDPTINPFSGKWLLYFLENPSDSYAMRVFTKLNTLHMYLL